MRMILKANHADSPARVPPGSTGKRCTASRRCVTACRTKPCRHPRCRRSRYLSSFVQILDKQKKESTIEATVRRTPKKQTMMEFEVRFAGKIHFENFENRFLENASFCTRGGGGNVKFIWRLQSNFLTDPI